MKTLFEVFERDGSEPDLEKIALEEEWAKGLMYCDMEGFALQWDGTLILCDECGKFAYPPPGRFEIRASVTGMQPDPWPNLL